MPDPLRMSFARLSRDTRVLLNGVETGRVNPSLDLVGRIGDALGLDLELVGRTPDLIAPRSTDLVHARCSGYVDRRFRLSGWIIRREVEVIHARSHGWIDLLAFHPLTRTLVIVEIKTRLDDLGAIERQVAWYERSVRDVVPMFGWRPSSVSTWLLLLESEEVEAAVQQRREVLRNAFPSRAVEMREVVRGVAPPRPGSRGLALIDPSSRRAAWLVPTRSDGRRSLAPYRDYADAARRITA